ncbi:hypothetical protein Asphe3_12690 [Pseudarthrobacter phenanthrenivorans Sphe3]|uniref:Uncharacterized protein n=1 Tax=Pseudarthrobacter phenanthrenivorans (strain DSM 18606 / JCM 16027 / LMG 23796 / Sphe3) TaxID=930171 RepID=F0M5R6_PSEPM|nr:hypothetical protein [Pseudarthrobacter phenanthrenivorans]ADX72446.1 hypothetical protein Asphe3_12690 [Pseudarthrobacter phenanthrenivorans Sphe3]
MSEDSSPSGEEEPPEPAVGSMGLGILLGAVALYGLYLVVPVVFGGPYGVRFLTGPSTFVPIAVYLAIAIVLAVRPRTARWGAGLLIGLGIFTLLGGGLCVSFLAGVRA